MNSDSLLNIINIIIKNEEKLEESPNEIYSLFKKHGYEGDIETLKLDLKNLLNDVIKSDEELSKVAGGKVSRLAAGAVAALTCLPMNSFASGTATTSRNKQSNVNKITDTIKSGAKKVGDATKEYVIEPVKDTAKTIARNPGKSAAVTASLAIYGLLSGLAGKKLASPPKVDTQGMTEQEKQTVEKTYKVFKGLTKYKVLHDLIANNYVVIEDKDKEKENKEYSWNLDELKPEEKPDGLSGKIKIGELVKELMPETIDLNPPTTTYTQVREVYIAYEKAQLAMLKKEIEKNSEATAQELAKVKQELETAKQNAEDLEKKYEELKKEKEKNEDELKKKTEELEKEKTENEEKLKENKEELEKARQNAEELEKKQEELKTAKQNAEEFKQKYEELELKLSNHAEISEYDNLIFFSRVSKMLSGKKSNPDGTEANVIRATVNKLLDTEIKNGIIPKFDQVNSKIGRTASNKLSLGDALMYFITSKEPPKNLQATDGHYLPEMQLVNQKTIPETLYTHDMQDPTFWFVLLTSNLTSEAKKDPEYTIGMEHPVIVRSIVYCLLQCHYNDKKWEKHRPIVYGIQQAIAQYPEKSQLLTTCLAKINIKCENGFLKWIDPNLK